MPYPSLPSGISSFGGDRSRRSESLLRSLKAVTGLGGGGCADFGVDGVSDMGDDGISDKDDDGGSNMTLKYSSVSRAGLSVFEGVEGDSGSVFEGVDGGGVDDISSAAPPEAPPEAPSEVLDTSISEERNGSVFDDVVRPRTVLLGSHASLRTLAGDIPI